jgi:hypothetical protein
MCIERLGIFLRNLPCLPFMGGLLLNRYLQFYPKEDRAGETQDVPGNCQGHAGQISSDQSPKHMTVVVTKCSFTST